MLKQSGNGNVKEHRSTNINVNTRNFETSLEQFFCLHRAIILEKLKYLSTRTPSSG
ncbi:hypothetical protein WN55_10039 [Dufourea novaeangliae]|uniref:Uncharacterized protein n=1 Tax=Dufourea novaeangliae TaxID=178035 RepID=A0A154PAB3_DUFNO|nr:hypothetical protein WN55_10039 [Dufourea novaeangliae]